MRVNRILIFISVILFGILLVQISQTNQLKKQLSSKRVDYKQQKINHQAKQIIVSEPDIQRINLSSSQTRVRQFIDLVQNNEATNYANLLADYTNSTIINKLTNTLAPSVQGSTLAHYDVPVVAVNKQWQDNVDFLVIAKSDVQSVAWQVTYDVTNQKVTDIARLPLKGAFDNEK
ncbi:MULTISPECIES: hypothetical protein [Leuconostoc]|uniref:hypothetical protein n=1 Tax=Leuconostoc TaxID=1243 RepID=UPI0006815A38|nr:hypothetical protein [Leuconostoc mesenteroides]KMY77356.1 hypothetical protein WZ79_07875 [Leuconostoc mesenteroides subsp. mesenteroides]